MKLIDRKEVTTLARATIYKKMSEGGFQNRLA